MGRKKKNNYMTSDEIYVEWQKWKETGVASEKLGRMMMTFAEHFLQMPSYNQYPLHVKEDLAQVICEKIMRNLHNMKEENKAGFFSYWTACGSSACADYLRHYYDDKNTKRKLLLEYLEQMQQEQPSPYNSHVLKQLRELIEQFDQGE